MRGPDLEAFHRTSEELDFLGPMESLLDDFHRGEIADPARKKEDRAIRSRLGGLHAAWDKVFPRFPDCPGKRRTALWEGRRGRRDAYLRGLISTFVPEHDEGRRLIVNLATVWGRHARDLASEMPAHQVIGTDIDHRGDWLYPYTYFWKHRGLRNYRFVKESIYEPDLQRQPAAVVFFGACGSLTDGGMDYALATGSPFLVCRSCCQENIGGNTDMVRRPGLLNWFFRWKNWMHSRHKRKGKWPLALYFSDRYAEGAYPRSKQARQVMDSETILAVARNSVDSDICRSLIDLDRCQYLKESGYDVLYREELFFAHRRADADGPD
jgi:hypothetical protein